MPPEAKLEADSAPAAPEANQKKKARNPQKETDAKKETKETIHTIPESALLPARFQRSFVRIPDMLSEHLTPLGRQGVECNMFTQKWVAALSLTMGQNWVKFACLSGYESALRIRMGRERKVWSLAPARQ